MHICLETKSLQQLASWLSWWFPHSTRVFRFLQGLPSTFRPVAMKTSRPSAKSSSRARWFEALPPRKLQLSSFGSKLMLFCWQLNGLKGFFGWCWTINHQSSPSTQVLSFWVAPSSCASSPVPPSTRHRWMSQTSRWQLHTRLRWIWSDKWPRTRS